MPIDLQQLLNTHAISLGSVSVESHPLSVMQVCADTHIKRPLYVSTMSQAKQRY
jgi:hypothetical protein